MAIEILLPRLGWTMEEGVFVEWLKRDGEQVQPGDLLFTIESDKATTEVESFEQGILRLPPDGPQPGSTLPVGAVLGYLVQPGERAPFEAEPASREPRAENRARSPIGQRQWPRGPELRTSNPQLPARPSDQPARAARRG